MKIIAPELHEPLIKSAAEAAFVDGIVESNPPSTQRFGIVQREMPAVPPFKPTLFGKGAEARFGKQHPAGKDIGLDEVGTCRILLEHIVGDGDILDRGTPSRPEEPRYRVEIVRPVALANGFDHFGADDGIETALDIAIVDQTEIGARCFSTRCLRPRSLRRRKRDGLHVVPFPSQPPGKMPPAAPDFEHTRSGVEPKAAGKRRPFAFLCRFKRFFAIERLGKERTRIAHRPIEP